MDRKLASIRQVRQILPIPGADNIELALIDGWQCVVKKGEFTAGTPCIYFEIDSFLPIRPEYEFLRKSCYRNLDAVGLGEGFRIKTIKLRGQLSQGLAIPVPSELQGLEIGTDLTTQLNVGKYDPVPNLCSTAQGPWPEFLRKSDQERVQNCYYDLLKDLYWVDAEFEATLKLDGSSMQVWQNNGQQGICSRNVWLKHGEEHSSPFWIAAKNQKLFEILTDLKRNLSFMGELMGPRIQGNRERLLGYEFFVYNIWGIDTREFLLPEETNEICQGYGLKQVPFVFRGHPLLNTLGELLELSDRRSLNHSVAEGLVWKSLTKHPETGQQVSFKVINNKFLLQES